MGGDLKSPLRYPGGKQKDIPFLAKVFDQFAKTQRIIEFREPFLGGGSVLLYAKANSLAQSYWGNDAHSLLMDFWTQVQEDVDALCEKVNKLRKGYSGPRTKSKEWTEFRQGYLKQLNTLPDDRLHRATRFFILNRSTSSGTTESGGMTPQAYCERFTVSSIDRLRALKGHLADIRFTCLEYYELLRAPGENVFIFLDPPYLSAETSGLYGKAGNLHKGFNHRQLAAELRICPHNWLMTIDNSPEILDLYSWANIYPWEKLYSMTNFDGRKSRGGQELLVASFKISTNISNTNSLTVVSRKREYIDPKKLKPHPLSLKIYGNEDNISDLVQSISEKGFFSNQRILVAQRGRYLEIISGHRRCRAAIKAGLNSVPIDHISPSLSQIEIESRVLDENLHRNKDGIQLVREYEYRKRIESTKATKDQLRQQGELCQNGEFSLNSSNEKLLNDAAQILGYERQALENGINALRTANRLIDEEYIEDAQKIFDFIRNKEFDTAWQLAQEIYEQINSDVIQGELLPEFSRRRCSLKGIANLDAEKIINRYGHNYAYIERLVELLEEHIGLN